VVLYNSGSIRLGEGARVRLQRGGDEAMMRGGEWANDDPVKPADFQGRYYFHHTSDLSRAVQSGQLPAKIMITVHPQRWTTSPVLWGKELVLQNVKNVVKRWLYVEKLRS